MKEAERVEGMVFDWSLGLSYVYSMRERRVNSLTVRLQKIMRWIPCLNCFVVWWSAPQPLSILPAASTEL